MLYDYLRSKNKTWIIVYKMKSSLHFLKIATIRISDETEITLKRRNLIQEKIKYFNRKLRSFHPKIFTFIVR